MSAMTSGGGDRRTREFDAGFAAGLRFAADLATIVSERVSGVVDNRRSNGAVCALQVLSDELRREIGAAPPQQSVASSSAPPRRALPEMREEARLKGYEGDPCPDCGSMTMVRNGTCLKCTTCGATTGCS